MRKDSRRDYRFRRDDEDITDVGVSVIRKFVIIAIVLFAVAYFASRIMSTNFLPIREVQINGELHYVEQRKIKQLVRPLIKGNFFTVDIKLIHKAIKQEVWVDRVSVRRIWPDIIRIVIFEARPLARWSGGGLITVDGEHMPVMAGETLVDLPYFEGPAGYYRIMVDKYKKMSKEFSKIDLTIDQVIVSQRRAWRLFLKNGIEVRLGRDDILKRVDRFTRVFSKVLKSKLKNIQAIDLRYTNGFAVQWKSDRKTKRYAFGS